MEKVSVIIPITERHDDINEIYLEYRTVLSSLDVDFEMIFVVDGDFEKAYCELKALKEAGEEIIIIKHPRSFGEAASLMSGFKESTGEIVLTLPAYFQVDITRIGAAFEVLKDADMVVVRRWPRRDSKLNQAMTRLFHYLVKAITEVDVQDIGCGVRLMKKDILEEINIYGDLHRFLPVLALKRGFKFREIELSQSEREKHVRTYSFGVYVRRLIDLLTVFFISKFTKKPLRFFGLAGTAILIPGGVITLYLITGRVLGMFPLRNRPLFLLGILLIVLGIQIFAIGLIGEIIIYTHAREIKEFHIEEIIN